MFGGFGFLLSRWPLRRGWLVGSVAFFLAGSWHIIGPKVEDIDAPMRIKEVNNPTHLQMPGQSGVVKNSLNFPSDFIVARWVHYDVTPTLPSTSALRLAS
jgi:hypothetical protein